MRRRKMAAAKAVGGDILLTLIHSVAELREDMSEMQARAGQMEAQARQMQAHAQQFQTHAQQMEAHARSANGHLRTLGNVLGRLARSTKDRLEDHEARLLKLESADS